MSRGFGRPHYRARSCVYIHTPHSYTFETRYVRIRVMHPYLVRDVYIIHVCTSTKNGFSHFQETNCRIVVIPQEIALSISFFLRFVPDFYSIWSKFYTSRDVHCLREFSVKPLSRLCFSMMEIFLTLENIMHILYYFNNIFTID